MIGGHTHLRVSSILINLGEYEDSQFSLKVSYNVLRLIIFFVFSVVISLRSDHWFALSLRPICLRDMNAMTLAVEDCNLVQYCYVHPGVGVGVGMPYGVDAYVDIDVYYTDVDADDDVLVLKSKGH